MQSSYLSDLSMQDGVEDDPLQFHLSLARANHIPGTTLHNANQSVVLTL